MLPRLTPRASKLVSITQASPLCLCSPPSETPEILPQISKYMLIVSNGVSQPIFHFRTYRKLIKMVYIDDNLIFNTSQLIHCFFINFIKMPELNLICSPTLSCLFLTSTSSSFSGIVKVSTSVAMPL